MGPGDNFTNAIIKVYLKVTFATVQPFMALLSSSSTRNFHFNICISKLRRSNVQYFGKLDLSYWKGADSKRSPIPPMACSGKLLEYWQRLLLTWIYSVTRLTSCGAKCLFCHYKDLTTVHNFWRKRNVRMDNLVKTRYTPSSYGSWVISHDQFPNPSWRTMNILKR